MHGAASKASAVIMAALLSLGISGCGRAPASFPKLGNVTSVVVSDHHGVALRTITDPGTISLIVVFADSQYRDWSIPRYGTVRSSTVANFYDGTQFKGYFGVAEEYFVCQRFGGTYAKAAGDAERREFLNLLQVAGQPD
jgi:hypothetical protein